MLHSCSLDNISIKLKCSRVVAVSATLRINYQGVNWDNMVYNLNINGKSKIPHIPNKYYLIE